jgi:glycosyltransferase involved in cell wall biosynthesis
MTLTSLAIDASRAHTAKRTGTENYSVEIIKALLLLDASPPITLYARDQPRELWNDGVDVRTIGPTRLWTHVGLSRAMIRDRPQALFVPSHVIPFAHPRASVVTVHDLGYLHEPAAHPRRQRVMLDRTTRWNARVAARLIAISAQTRADLISQYGVDPGRIDVVHHGLDHDRFKPQTQDTVRSVRRNYAIPGPYLLFVSTVQPRKNLDRLLDAFEFLGLPDLTLVVAGKSGWMSANLEQRIQRQSLEGRLLRLGHVADHDLPALYAGAAAFVLPSLFEGFGMGIIEAMACGTPVVTSNVGSMAEVAGGAAILVDPESVSSIAGGIRQALGPDRTRKLRADGLVHAATFSWKRAAERTLDIIVKATNAA